MTTQPRANKPTSAGTWDLGPRSDRHTGIYSSTYIYCTFDYQPSLIFPSVKLFFFRKFGCNARNASAEIYLVICAKNVSCKQVSVATFLHKGKSEFLNQKVAKES